MGDLLRKSAKRYLLEQVALDILSRQQLNKLLHEENYNSRQRYKKEQQKMMDVLDNKVIWLPKERPMMDLASGDIIRAADNFIPHRWIPVKTKS